MVLRRLVQPLVLPQLVQPLPLLRLVRSLLPSPPLWLAQPLLRRRRTLLPRRHQLERRPQTRHIQRPRRTFFGWPQGPCRRDARQVFQCQFRQEVRLDDKIYGNPGYTPRDRSRKARHAGFLRALRNHLGFQAGRFFLNCKALHRQCSIFQGCQQQHIPPLQRHDSLFPRLFFQRIPQQFFLQRLPQ